MGDHKAYWENYVTYWQTKIKESNDESIKCADKSPGDELIHRFIDKLDVKADEMFLDYGCFVCRIYPYMKAKGLARGYYGADISTTALNIALEQYPDLKNKLKDTDGEHIPFNGDTFDKVLCFGTFDACPQELIMSEILRVLTPVGGGHALITGKNMCYLDEDEAAMYAETRARENGHPNYFTDVASLIRQLEQKNVSVIDAGFTLLRGDFSLGKFHKTMPERFYEYFIMIEKTEKSILTPFDRFSDAYSQTFKCENRIMKG